MPGIPRRLLSFREVNQVLVALSTSTAGATAGLPTRMQELPAQAPRQKAKLRGFD
jgi:hypothetical protein